MSTARVGWIGGNSPGFYNMNFEETKIRSRFGTRVIAHEFAELAALTESVEDAEAQQVVEDLTAAASQVLAGAEGMVQGARLYLALKELAAINGYSALAVQCWPKFQEILGIAPCMAYSWLGSEDSFAVSCEGDVPGALSMLLLNELRDRSGSSTLLDMTALDPETDTMLMWHCGVSPRHFANSDGITWIDHPTLGRKSPEVYGVAGDQVFAPQETTITYVGDNASELLVVRARIEEHPAKGFIGTRGWFGGFELNGEPIDLADLVNTLVVRGHEHHYAVGQGNSSDELLEIAAWLGMRTVERVGTARYLQIPGVNC
jgi:L-fucose isomerase-like protein